MSIRDFIDRKKREFFVARDTDKLELQKNVLIQQRKELEIRRNLENDVRKEQANIRALRSEPARRRLDAVKKGFQNLKEGAAKSQKSVERFSGSNSPFSPGGNPFGKDSQVRTAEKKGKTITVKIRE